MAEEINLENIKIKTFRPEGQKREYSTYVEISATTRDVSLKFCDLKPPSTKQEIEDLKKNGVKIQVNTEIVLPFDVALSLTDAMRSQLNIVKEKSKKEGI